jgi:molecular chaperone GrpE
VTKSKKQEDLEQQLGELTLDLQRTRADFENYRKRVELEKRSAREYGQKEMIGKMLPIIDDIKRAIGHIPLELTENAWVQGIVTLSKNLDTSIDKLGIRKIHADLGVTFDPLLHHAVQFDEESEGEQEVVAEELQAGYMLGDQVLREAMVKVKRQ